MREKRRIQRTVADEARDSRVSSASKGSRKMRPISCVPGVLPARRPSRSAQGPVLSPFSRRRRGPARSLARWSVTLNMKTLPRLLAPSSRLFSFLLFFQPPPSHTPFLSSKKNKNKIKPHHTQSSSRACPTCGGSGTVTCNCTRWSDSSSDSSPGCGSCGGSLRSACHHCRGGGRAIPLMRRVHVERSAGPYDGR